MTMQAFLHRQQTKWRSFHRGNSALHSRIFLSVLALVALMTCLVLPQKARTVRAESKDSAKTGQKLGSKPSCKQGIQHRDLSPLVVMPPHPVPRSAAIFNRLTKSDLKFGLAVRGALYLFDEGEPS